MCLPQDPPICAEYRPCGCCPLWDADVGDLCACADAAAAWSCWEAVGRAALPPAGDLVLKYAP